MASEQSRNDQTAAKARLRRLQTELIRRIRRGQTQVTETLLAEHPTLIDDRESVIDLIYLEYTTREELGARPNVESFCDRFPQWRDQIERLLKIHEVLAADDHLSPTSGERECPVPGYQIVRKIGSGGMGTVYVAEQRSVKRLVALKVLHDFICGERTVIERFHQEAVTLGLLSHPNIASIYASGVENGVHFLAMQYCDGKSLQALFDRRSESTEDGPHAITDKQWCHLVLHIGMRVADAIHYAHDNGILHRDIKPSNIIVNERTADVWIVDFGLAKVLDCSQQLTHGPLGTLGFSSPEQLKGGDVDARSDVYSLGVTLRRLLTQPSDGHAPLVWLNDVDDSLVQVITRATEAEPDLRYQSMAAFRDDLAGVAQGEPIQPRRFVTARKLALRVMRRKFQATVLGALLLTLLLLGVLFHQEREKTKGIAYRQHIETAVMKLHLDRLLSLVDDAEIGIVDHVRDAMGADDPLRDSLLNLDRAIKLLPKKPEARYFRACALAALARTQEALAELDRALTSDRRFVPAEMLRAHLLNQEIAGQPLKPSRSVQDNNRLAEWLAAESALSKREYSEAAQTYQRLFDSGFTPPFVGCLLDARLKRIEALFANQEYAAAIEELAVIRTQYPQRLEPQLLIAKAYLYNRAESRAESIFHRIHTLTSDSDEAAIWISVIYHARNDREKTDQWLARIHDDYLRRYLRIWVLNLRRENHAAELLARESIRLYPKKAALYLRLSEDLRVQAKFAQALEASKTAAQLDSSLAIHHMLIRGGVLLRQGEMDEAEVAFSEAFRLIKRRGPQDLWKIADCYVSAGQHYMTVARFEEATRYFQKALQLDPHNDRAHYLLGIAHLNSGNPNKSVTHFRMAAKLKPRHAGIHWHHGEARLLTGDWCEAYGAFVRALELDAFERWSIADKLFTALADEGPQFFCADSQGFHSACGTGERLVKVLERVVADQEDAEAMMILALAHTCVSSRIDLGKAYVLGQRAVELSGSKTERMANAYARLIRNLNNHFMDVAPSERKALRYPTSLPPFYAIDALLKDGIPKPEDFLRRFAVVSRSGESAIRLTYLKARLEQIAGHHSVAAERFWTLVDQGRVEADIVTHLLQCLRAIGDSEGERSLAHRLESAAYSTTMTIPTSPGGGIAETHSSEQASIANDFVRQIGQWDFNHNLESSVGGQRLTPGAARPATIVDFSFEDVELAGGVASSARFARGVFFRAEPGFVPYEAYHGFTIIMDVNLSLESGTYAALLQTNESNRDDADWSVHPRFGIGLGSYAGEIKAGQWYRLALVVDPKAGCRSIYVDGQIVEQRPLSKRLLHHYCRKEAIFLLFADDTQENTSGVVSSVQIRNYPMSPAQLAVLGGPTAGGILRPVDPAIRE